MLTPREKKIAVFGIPGSGKTYWAKWFIKTAFRKPLIYEVHPDFRDMPNNVLIHKPNDLSNSTLDKFCLKVKQLGKQKKIDCFVLDEADMFFRSNYDLCTNLNDLVINHRHYNLALLFVTRRPQDIPTKIVESCFYQVIFMVEGANVFQKFKNVDPRIFELMKKLDYHQHNFIVKEIGKAPYLCNPIKV